MLSLTSKNEFSTLDLITCKNKENMDILSYVLIALVVLALIFVKKTVVIIPQSETKIIERLGKYFATLSPGINLIIPFIDRPKEMVTMRAGRYVYSNTIDLREQVYDFDRQNVITKDNIQMQINALLYFQIVDPFKAVYEISNLPNAIEKLTQTTLRNIIGEMELDQTLTSRDTINTKLRAVLDDATNKWQAILQAEGEAQARIRKAEAEAVAIEKITEAVGKSTNPANYLLAQKYIQMMQEVAQGDQTKMVYLPYEATNMLGSIGGIKELFKGE